MEFTVMERVALLSILPKEGSFLTIKLLRKVREDLSFSDEELKDLDLKFDAGRTVWNQKKAEEMVKEVEIGEIITEEISELLKGLNKDKKLRDEHISLYEKFVEKSE